MRTCANCGRLIADERAVECPQCGAPAPGAAPDQTQSWAPTWPAEYGAPTAPSQPMYPPATAPGYPYGAYPQQPAAPSQPLYPPANYGQPGAYSQPMYPYGGYPPQPAAPSQPVYPYSGYPSGAPPAPYGAAPGANWRPAAQPKTGMPVWLIVTLVVALVAVIGSGVGYGVYALTASRGGHNPLAVGANATATPTSSSVLLDDPLTSNSNGWSEGTHCFFDATGYHIVSNANEGWLCYAPVGSIADGRVSVTVKQLAGATRYPFGISFRFNQPATHYFFAIDANSKWVLFKVVNDKYTRLKDYTFNASIHGGLHAINTLTVEFRGQRITCSANGVQLGVVTDSGSPLGGGKVALEALDGANVVFTHFVAEQ